ncbi:ABC transporter permease [Methanobacterium alcaliphilum]|uniref:ABC transporter permease n=1 Tax=Methanobacterium alcaliphilum TaxID=392018 RepID=UPI00200B4A10|nr:ABC transporter permease [Methanobacterium alcaliphilum]MCK9152242.1 ABC transporter permease [Methanobacterium alcaliphilum]
MLDHRFIKNFTKYKFLLVELVKRDITVKYRGSVLGILWSFLNPLLHMMVLTIVFGTFFGKSIPNFAVYALTGFLIFSFFSSATTLSMNSIKKGAPILKKMYVPKYIYALAGILSETINLLISMIVLILVMLFTGCPFSIFNLTAIIPIFFLFIFTIGCGLILATINVFFKDVKYLYGVFTRLLLYGCAIFYPITIIPEQFIIVFYANPVYCAISGLRDSILYGTLPGTGLLLYLSLISVITLIIGIIVFYKSQDKFILHL